jgi:hypothetical protein
VVFKQILFNEQKSLTWEKRKKTTKFSKTPKQYNSKERSTINHKKKTSKIQKNKKSQQNQKSANATTDFMFDERKKNL